MPDKAGQLLSADPSAGFLSADPNAGISAPEPQTPMPSMFERPKVVSDFEPQPEPSPLLEMLRPLAHPTSVKDLLPLLLPNGIAMAVEGGKHYVDAARAAYANARSVKKFPTEFVKVLFDRAFETNAASASRKLMSSGIVERYGPAAKTAASTAQEFAPGADVERFKSVVRALSPEDLAHLRKEGAPGLQKAILSFLIEKKTRAGTKRFSIQQSHFKGSLSPFGVCEK